MQSDSHILTAVVAKAQQGDTLSLSWLYDSYVKAMFNICVRMIGNKAKAEDVLHDSFVAAFSNLKNLKDTQQFGAWLKRIVINKCLTNLKSDFKWKGIMLVDLEFPDEDTDYYKEVSVEIINTEIANLPEGCRQVFVLYVFEELTHKEIGDVMKISESTSKTQFQRARQLLRKRLNHLVDG